MPRPKTVDDETLLAIAREVFVREGAFGSTREIARQVGLSEAALFKRFSTKAALFLAAMAPPVMDTQAMVEEAARIDDTRAALAFIADRSLGFFRECLPVIMPLLRNPLISPDAVHAHFGRGQAVRLTESIAGYIARETARGRLRAVEPFPAAALIVSSLHSIALFELMGFHDGAVPPGGVQAMLDILWTGLAPQTITAEGSQNREA
jgi:AcrR family transcriptional regulator